jgi:hypothetical protein
MSGDDLRAAGGEIPSHVAEGGPSTDIRYLVANRGNFSNGRCCSLQILQEQSRLCQIRRVETFTEPAENWFKEIAGFIASSLVSPKPR